MIDLVIGMDVGSTTVKAVVIEPDTKEILWHDYQRHHTKQPETVLEFLTRIMAAFPDHPPYGGEFGDDVRPHLTVDAASEEVSLASTAALLRDVVPVEVVLDTLQLAWWETGRCHVVAQWPLGG